MSDNFEVVDPNNNKTHTEFNRFDIFSDNDNLSRKNNLNNPPTDPHTNKDLDEQSSNKDLDEQSSNKDLDEQSSNKDHDSDDSDTSEYDQEIVTDFVYVIMKDNTPYYVTESIENCKEKILKLILNYTDYYNNEYPDYTIRLNKVDNGFIIYRQYNNFIFFYETKILDLFFYKVKLI